MSELNIKGPQVAVITGFEERTSQLIIVDVRKTLGKSKKQYLSLREFCSIKDIDYEYAKERLRKYNML